MRWTQLCRAGIEITRTFSIKRWSSTGQSCCATNREFLSQQGARYNRGELSKPFTLPSPDWKLAFYTTLFIRKASPISHVSKSCPPLLLIYGTSDNQVTIAPVGGFVTALHQAGVADVTYIRLGLVDHYPYSLRRIETLCPIVDEFFARTLNPPSNRRIAEANGESIYFRHQT